MQYSKLNKPKKIRDKPVYKQQDNMNDDMNYAKTYHEFLFDREGTRMRMKKWFFWTIISIYAFLILFSCCLFIAAAYVSKETALALVIGSLINLISTNIALPLIIAKNLFQSTENDNLQLFFDNYVKVIQLPQNLEEKSTFYSHMVNEKMHETNTEKISTHNKAADIVEKIVAAEDDNIKIT